jgi:DNA-binding HxlR family transcriptional regulator
MDDRAQAYLAALSNPKRMSIVKALHEKPLTFTQLLAGTGIEDSSLLNFHLKKLQDLVERREGFYCLTEEGTRVFEILSSLKEPVKERSMDVMQPTPLGRGTSERPCSDCGRKIDVLADLCPYCHSRQVRMVVSSLWYLVPVFLLWVGGLVAWFVNKDIDPRCARKILIFGFVWTPIAVVLFLLALLLL